MRDAPHQTPGEDPAPLKTVLLVEDNVDIRDALSILLHEATPYQVIGVPDGFAARHPSCGHSSPISLCSIICCLIWMAWNVWTCSEQAKEWSKHPSFS